jgi:hypothetical protein
METSKNGGRNAGRVRIRHLSTEEGWRMLDQAAQRYLHMSGKDFLRLWDAGKFDDVDTPDVVHVGMLVPLAR